MPDLTTLRIESERLLLVPISMEYKEDVFREFQEPVTRFMYPRAPEKIEETEQFIAKSVNELRDGTNCQLVILNKTTNEFFGGIGYHKVRTATPEVGLWVKQSAHGHHYGREAMHALVDWIRSQRSFDHIVYDVATENIASRKVAESLGGTVAKEYEKTMQSGRTYHMLQYWIPYK